MVTITVTNKKGGVAKTTSVANLASEFEARGLRVLTVDLDPQSTLTAVAGVDLETLAPEQTVLAALIPDRLKTTVPPVPVEAAYGGMLLPASPALVEAESVLGDASIAGPTRRLARALEQHADNFDVCFVDTPPSFGRLVVNALSAADYLVVPLTPDFASLKGFSLMLETIKMIREYDNPKLEILGVFPAQARRTLHARETMNSLYRQLGEMWIDIQVPQAVAVQDAQASRISLREYDHDGKATIAYRLIADTLLRRLASRGVHLIEERRSA